MASSERALIRVRVHPNAARSEVLGVREGVLHVKVAAPPVDGKANVALVDLLSGLLGLGKSRVVVERGHSGRIKTVAVSGMEKEDVVRRLSR